MSSRRTADGHYLFIDGEAAGALVWVCEQTLRDGWWLQSDGWPAMQLYRVPVALAGSRRARHAGESACLGFAEIILSDRHRGLLDRRVRLVGGLRRLLYRSMVRLLTGCAQAVRKTCRVAEQVDDCPGSKTGCSRATGESWVGAQRQMFASQACEQRISGAGLFKETQSLLASVLAAMPRSRRQMLEREIDREVEAFGDRAILLALARHIPAIDGGRTR